MGDSDEPSHSAAGAETRDPVSTLAIWGANIPLPHWAVNIVAPIAIFALLGFVVIHLRQDWSQAAQTQQQIEQLNQQNLKLQSRLEERYTISGVVQVKSGSVTGLPIYAGSYANLGEDGKFRFENMLNGYYYLVLVGQDKNLHPFVIDSGSTETGGAGFTITYKYDKE